MAVKLGHLLVYMAIISWKMTYYTRKNLSWVS